MAKYLGVSVNGKPAVSKTATGGSIPSAPAVTFSPKPCGLHNFKGDVEFSYMKKITPLAFMTGTMIAALAALFYGFSLRFHIENTQDTMIQSGIGAKWLLLAIFIFLLNSWIIWIKSRSYWATIAVTSPIVAAMIALLYEGNIIPYFLAMFTGLAAIIGFISVLLGHKK
jgi:hypothetical protein